MRRILITGGTGFVGPHLVRFLKSSGTKLTVLSSGEARAKEPGVDYRCSDIRNAEEIRAVIRDTSPDHIYHLAGISSVPVSWRDPRLTLETNVIGSYNVFDAAMGLPTPPKILNVSTSQVYAPDEVALTETSRISPANPYAASKAMAELLAVQYQRSTQGGVITARAFNHTGPGQATTFALPSFARQLAEMEAGLRPPVLKVGNIQVRRDFTDVRDVIVAYSLLLEKGAVGEVYNVCSGRAVLLADIVKNLQKHCRVAIRIEIDSVRIRTDDVPVVVGDASKLRSATGWSATVPLERTMNELLAYWRRAIQGDTAREGARLK